MDLGTFESIINQFKQRRAKPIADYDHFSEGSTSKGDGDKIAAGHVEDLKIMNGDLYASICWTERAKSLIKNREYSYLSPAIIFNGIGSDGKVIPARLSSIGLVNRPYLHQLEPVLASENGSVAICCSEISDSEIAELASVELNDEHAEELVTLADLHEAVLQATEPLTVQLHDAQLERDVEAAQVSALKKELKLMTDAAHEARVEDAFQTYKESRKLGATAKRTMRLVLASDPELFESEYPKLKTGPSYLLRKLSDEHPGNSATLAEIKTVPTLASLIDQAKASHPSIPYDAQFDLALHAYNTAQAQGMH